MVEAKGSYQRDGTPPGHDDGLRAEGDAAAEAPAEEAAAEAPVEEASAEVAQAEEEAPAAEEAPAEDGEASSEE